MFFLSMMVKLIWSNSLNQINLIIYKAKFDTFLFDQFSLIKFWKNRTCSISSNQFDEIESIKIKIPKCEEKITKIKVQMNEHEIQIFPIICLLVCLLVGSISLIFKEKNIYICVLTTFTRRVFRIQSNIYDGVFLRE